MHDYIVVGAGSAGCVVRGTLGGNAVRRCGTRRLYGQRTWRGLSPANVTRCITRRKP